MPGDKTRKLTIDLVAADDKYAIHVRELKNSHAEGKTLGEALEALEPLLEQHFAPSDGELLTPEAEVESATGPDASPLRDLPVDLDEVVQGMEQHDRDLGEYHLDLQTGQIVVTIDGFDLDDDDESNLPVWRKREQAQRRLMRSQPDRFQCIPESDTREAWEVMAGFVSHVRDRNVQRKLESAIEGQGAFRRFRDILFGYPQLTTKWCEYESSQKRQWARDWLHSLGIRSTWRPPGRLTP